MTALSAVSVVFGLTLAIAVAADAPPPASATATDLFAKRIMPIFKSKDPSSCTKCHLAGVDLKNYIRPTSDETFLSLRDQGMVDLNSPKDSKILRFIAMTDDQKAGAALLSDKVKKAEYDAFSAWIEACAADPKLVNADKLRADQLAKPARPVEVIRYDRMDRVRLAFKEEVWPQVEFRCAGCHMVDAKDTVRLSKENGDIAWMKKTSDETFESLRAGGFIDTKVPEKSLLLLKPMNVVKHGGGQKILVGDMTYKGFRSFLEDYSKVINDKFAKPADLPKPVVGEEHYPTESWLKLTKTPPAWGDKLLRVEVYAQDASGKGFEKDPIAISDRAVSGSLKAWQHVLVGVAMADSERGKTFAKKPELPGGTYQIKVYVDVAGRLAKDWTASLDEREYVGAVTVRTKWAAGYGSMTAVDATTVKK